MVTNHVSKHGSGRGKSDEKVSVVRAGSVTLKIYTLRHGDRVRYTVSWHVGPKRHRKHFSCLQRARAFAKERAEALAAGQVHGPQFSTAQAQDTKEALRRLGGVDMPLHVVAGEYADLKRTIGERGTLRQAVEFYPLPGLDRTLFLPNNPEHASQPLAKNPPHPQTSLLVRRAGRRSRCHSLG
jgi:biotin carboxylase